MGIDSKSVLLEVLTEYGCYQTLVIGAVDEEMDSRKEA